MSASSGDSSVDEMDGMPTSPYFSLGLPPCPSPEELLAAVLMKASVTLSTKEISDLVQGSTSQRRRVIEARVGRIDAGTFVSLVNMTTQGPSAPALAAVDAAPAPAAAAAAPAAAADDDDDNHLADSASNVAGQQAQEAMKAASVTLCSSAWSSRKEAVTAVMMNATRQGAKLQQLLYKIDPDGKKINVGGGARVELR